MTMDTYYTCTSRRYYTTTSNYPLIQKRKTTKNYRVLYLNTIPTLLSNLNLCSYFLSWNFIQLKYITYCDLHTITYYCVCVCIYIYIYITTYHILSNVLHFILYITHTLISFIIPADIPLK
jgi:hypothetical protein